MGHADIVVQDSYRTKGDTRLRHGVFDRGELRDIGRDRDSPPTLVFDDASCFLCRRHIQIDAGHGSTFAGIKHCGGLAVAPTRPGGPGAEHNGGLVLQAVCHLVLISRKVGRRLRSKRRPLSRSDQVRLVPTAFSRMPQASSPNLPFHSE